MPVALDDFGKRLSEEISDTLVDRVRDGMCTPFLGPELLRPDALDPASVAADWARDEHFPFSDSRNLPRVAEYLAVGKDKYEPRKRIMKTFGALKLEASQARRVYESLAELPFPLFVCTYYDDLISQALQAAKIPFPRKVQRKSFSWHADLRDRVADKTLRFDRDFEASIPAPVVFHWYGHVDHAQSLVVTERDHMDFLHHFASRKDILPPAIDLALGGNYLMFLGYSLFELSFQILLRALKEQILGNPFRKRHLAVQLADVESEEEREQAEKYLREYLFQEEIQIVLGDTDVFVAELHRRVSER